MQKKLVFFSKDFRFTKSTSPLIYIMLSGFPCTGKSTWRAKMLSALTDKEIPVTTISADDIACQMRDELNQTNNFEPPLTYKDINSIYRSDLEARYKNSVLNSTLGQGVVILDRTYLTISRRKELLNLVKPNPVYLVSFEIHDESAWHERLLARNKRESDKKITEEIVALLSKDANLPTVEEGFEHVAGCCAVGEQGWENEFDITVEELVKMAQAAISEAQGLKVSETFNLNPF